MLGTIQGSELFQGVKEDSRAVQLWEPLLTAVQESRKAQDVLAHSQEAISLGGGDKSTPGRDWRVSQRNEQSQICLGKKPIYGERKLCVRGQGVGVCTHQVQEHLIYSSEPWCFQKPPADIGGLR